uniref:lysozyme n=1 Tax=Acinetobacter ursingii TaxID=108980 RepID=UPI00300A9510
MKISNNGLNLIKQFEGLKLNAYDDGVGVWTIGYGTIKYPNGVRVKHGDKITQAQADQYIANDVATFERAVNMLVNVPLNQNQFDALVSFTYNLGATNLSASTLLKKLNSKDYNGAAGEFQKWNKAGGKVMTGLVRRRKAEMELFNK